MSFVIGLVALAVLLWALHGFSRANPHVLAVALKTGGGIGALASSGRSGQRVVEVTVQFDNGERGVFDYRDWSPFRPGQRVVATPNGLQPA